MTVESIKEDIRKTLPPKEEPKPFSWNEFMINTEFEQLFSSLFDTYNIGELLEDYKSDIESYE